MTEPKPRRLNEVVSPFASQGANDRIWFVIEHLLMDARNDVQIAHDYLSNIMALPENEEEREVAENCCSIIRSMRLDIQKHYATFLSYLSDTDVPERISRKEL